MKPSEIAEGIMATADGGKSGLGIRADHVESLARAYLRLREACKEEPTLLGGVIKAALEESDEDI